MNDLDFRRHVRHLAIAWLALLALMLASLGSAYLPLGAGNAIAGTGIAIVKATIVVTLFMGLGRAGPLLRLVAASGLLAWGLLLALGGLDAIERPRAPATLQVPQQVTPLIQEGP